MSVNRARVLRAELRATRAWLPRQRPDKPRAGVGLELRLRPVFVGALTGTAANVTASGFVAAYR